MFGVDGVEGVDGVDGVVGSDGLFGVLLPSSVTLSVVVRYKKIHMLAPLRW